MRFTRRCLPLFGYSQRAAGLMDSADRNNLKSTMSAFSTRRCIFSLFLTLAALPLSCFSLKIPNSASFLPEIALFGDAAAAADGSRVSLTRHSTWSSGLLMRNKPFTFLGGNLQSPMSFSTEFSFSISPQNGDGIALVFVPRSFVSRFGSSSFGLPRENRFVGVEYDTSMDGNVGDTNANHVGIDVGSLVSATTRDVSSINLVLNSGEKLKSWVDYDAGSKRIEVRLAKVGDARPHNPLLAQQFDFSAMWGGEEVFVGITSSNRNTSQTSNVYSWWFRLRQAPLWMHSLPADPHNYSNQPQEHIRRLCPLTILAGLIFATACGALMAFVLLFLWAILVSRWMVFPAEYIVQPLGFRYEKIDLVVEKGTEDVKN